MQKRLIRFLVIMLSAVITQAAVAQVVIKGQIVDAGTNEPLIGATVRVVGGTQGASTNFDGYFSLTVPQNSTLSFQYIGYKELIQEITQKQNADLGVIRLSPDAYALEDVIITSSIAVARKTPVAMTTMSPVFIEERLGMQDFPELLKSTPSVYVSKGGGGFGDTEISLRGFKTANIAVLVNGVPMNDMEWGGVYWSNWTALSDVTRSQQVQRGLGAAKLSSPSIGGSINIITNSLDAKKGGSVSYGMGMNGYNKLVFSVSTGISDKGWAFSLLGSKEWADGYIQGTEYESYTYFVNLSKRLNDDHQLSLTAFGSPQWHNQRSSYDGLSIEGWQKVKQYMPKGDQYRYNPTFGYGKNGERKHANRNEYHKPQISLNHQWQIDPGSSLSTALYVSIGDGSGHSGQNTSSYSGAWYGATNGVLNTQFRNADGTFAYDQIQDINEQSANGSQMVMSLSKNQHIWYGLLSTYTKELNERWTVSGGIDARYYKGTHTNQISDLFNGAYYIDRYRANVKAADNAAAADDSFKYKKLGVGDVVYRDYDGYVVQGGLFGQAEYSTDKLSAFASASYNRNSQWRYDRFYYDKAHAKSEKVGKNGFTVKAGANYNINRYHNVFANVGYLNRIPFMSGGIFYNATTSHMVNKGAKNEKTYGFEAGYGFQSKYLTVNVNLYRTEWRDKATTNYSDMLVNGETDRASINITGVDATHDGFEVEFTAKPLHWLDVKGSFSMGDWRWKGSAKGYWYSSGGEALTSSGTIASEIAGPDHASSTITFNDTKVSGSAQTTAALGLNIRPAKDFRIGVDWNLAARNYSQWEMTNPVIGGNYNYDTPWRIPSRSTFDMNASYSFEIAGLKTTLSGNMTNVFDQEYIQSAYDSNGTWQGAYRVFYGFGRQMSMRLKINF